MSSDDGDRRVQARRPVNWEAECRLGGSSVTGKLRDISGTGAFFADDPDLPFSGENDLRGMLEPDDQVILTFTTARFAKARRTLATVKWMGRSDGHRCHGIGLKFDDGET